MVGLEERVVVLRILKLVLIVLEYLILRYFGSRVGDWRWDFRDWRGSVIRF